MRNCELCTGGITSKKAGLLCSESCKNFVHGECVDLSKEDMSRFAQPDVYWFCSGCRVDPTSKRLSIIDEQVGSIEDNDLNNSTSLRILMDMRVEMKTFNKKYDDLIKSVTFCCDQITAFDLLLNKFNDNVSD